MPLLVIRWRVQETPQQAGEQDQQGQPSDPRQASTGQLKKGLRAAPLVKESPHGVDLKKLDARL
jgi:hypothetical protein